MAYLETGVDKLVALVGKQKRIELAQAAKELKVDPAVVQEWAEFLEEEGIASLEYSLSKTFIVEKRLTKTEIVHKEKEYEGRKEAFVRRVDAALKHLDDDTAGFEDIKKQYDEMKRHLGHDLDEVKEEMEQLRHFEELKKSIDGDIAKQRDEYRRNLEEVRGKVAEQEGKYKKILTDIESESSRIGKELAQFKGLKQEEQEVMRRLTELTEAAKKMSERVRAQGDQIAQHEGRLTTLRELAERLNADIVQKRKRDLEPLLKISDDQGARIMRIQDEILAKAKARSDKVHEFERESAEVVAKFTGFFERRAQTDQLLKDLEKAKAQMHEDLQELIRKARAFEVAKGADAAAHLKELESKFGKFDQDRGTFAGKLERLKDLLMGKGGAEKKAAPAPAAKGAGAGKAKQKPSSKGAKKKPAAKRSPGKKLKKK